LKCPYCGIDYNSNISFNAHVQNCFYRDNSLNKEKYTLVEIPVYENMKYGELKSLANSKGIRANKMKKEDIINALKDLEG